MVKSKTEVKKNKYKLHLKAGVEEAQQIKNQMEQKGLVAGTAQYNDQKGTLEFASTDTKTRKKIRSLAKTVKNPPIPKELRPPKEKTKYSM